MKLRLFGAACAVVLLAAQGAQAAQQCVGTMGPSTFGSLTVTVTGVGCQDFAASDAFSSNVLLRGPGTCQFSFSSPVSTASIVASVDSLDSAVITSSINAAPYAVQVSDILAGPLSGAEYAPSNGIAVSGSGVTAAGTSGDEGSGSFGFRTSAPATTSTLTLTQTTSSGTLVQVCFDDNTTPVTPAAPIPTMSEWALMLLGMLLAGGTALYLQRRRSLLG